MQSSAPTNTSEPAETPEKRDAERSDLRIVKFRLGQYVVDVVLDNYGVFRGIARITATLSPNDKLSSRPAAFQDIERYYDTSEP